MTLRKLALIATILPAMAGFFACNSSYDSLTLSSSAAVKSFSLTEDDSIAANLDSVFFSIDLAKGLIFNADSLPYGTDVTRLIPVITTLETASEMKLIVTRANGTDTTYNYLENSTDSIDFTNPVKLRVVSYDGLTEMTYTVNVNVHKVVSDSLTWNRDALSALPSTISNPTGQRTVQSNGAYYCLTTDGSAYCLASYTPTATPTNAPGMLLENWEKNSITFPFAPQVESFAATDETFFLLADDGALWMSDSHGDIWAETGLSWNAVYGNYGDRLLGSVETENGWMIQSYPTGDLTPLPAGMPVSGTSMPASYTFPLSSAEQMVIVGGRLPDGSLTPDTWGFDGTSWVKLSKRPLPVALENVAMAMYFSFKTSSAWITTSLPTLVAIGGRASDGTISTAVYISNDYGINWVKAASTMQLPEYITPVWGAQLFVVDSFYDGNIKPLVSKPTETWACPYIYLFGGYDSAGTFQNTLWRGVINRLSFKPIE